MTNPPSNVARLTASRIQFTDEQLDWRSAIRLVGQPLVDEGAVTPGYVDAAIAIAEDKGPFYDLGKGIAMPHARPEAGANEIGLSLLRTRQPVLLLDREDHPIDIFIMLSATDPNTHIDVLRQLAGILTDDDAVAALKSATTPDAVLDVFAGNN